MMTILLVGNIIGLVGTWEVRGSYLKTFVTINILGFLQPVYILLTVGALPWEGLTNMAILTVLSLDFYHDVRAGKTIKLN